MSRDSSKPFPPEERKGARIAVLALFGIVGLFFCSQVVAGTIISLIPAVNRWSSAHASAWLGSSIAAQFTYVLIADALLVLGVAGLLKLFRWDWRAIGLVRPRLRHILVGMGAVVPYYLLYVIVVLIMGALIPSLNVAQKQDIGFNSVHGSAALVLTFISLAVLPPLAEEIAMRGFLYTGLRKWLPRIAAGVCVSVLFGAAHLAEGGAAGPLWIGAIDTFTLSLVLVFLREKTGNLWAGITLHALKNSIAFVLLFVVGGR